jgi:sulfur relay (sulfurtransferase) DsrC/TusE family protein
LLHIFDADGKAVMATATKQINRLLDTEEFISDPEMWSEDIAKVVAFNDRFPKLTRDH